MINRKKIHIHLRKRISINTFKEIVKDEFSKNFRKDSQLESFSSLAWINMPLMK